jgi:hypothetical protein
MNDGFDSYETFGPSVERPVWSWSYLRKPTVLFLWLACAALCAFLADRKQQPGQHAPTESAPERRHQNALRIVRDEEQATGRSDGDEDARAA